MKIKHKLVLGFAGIASLVGIVGYISTYVSQKALQQSIGENTVVLAIETMDKIDREIYHIIEEFQAYCKDSILQQAITESNREFDKLQNIHSYIDKIDSEWISMQIADKTSLLYELCNNEISEDLYEKIEFHNQNHGYKVLGEIIVTNKYGANIALTGKTSDYRQDDELWWQKAKAKGLYLYSTEFDESSRIYSTTIAVRIEDENGDFAGALKVVTNIEDTIKIIKQCRNPKYRSVTTMLFTLDGKLIYDTSNKSEFLEDISGKDFFTRTKGFSGYFINKPENVESHDGQKKLIAYARSRGFKNNYGLNWILATEYQANDLFAAVIAQRNIIVGTSLISTLSAIYIGLLFSYCISKPISELRKAIDQIDKGNMDVHIDIKNNNELGQLVAAFNKMTKLRKLASAALQKARDELDERVHHRTIELAKANTNLESEIAKHKKTEQALRDSERRLNAILNSILTGVLVIDVETHIIVDINPLATELIGLPKNEIIGKVCHDFICPAEFGKCPKCDLGQVLDKTECVLLTENRRQIPIFKSVTSTTHQGHEYLIESFVDITSRKEAEQEMEKLNADLELANKELIRANKELKEFTNIAAHDLKTPLRAIGVLANWLSKDYAEKFDEQGREQVKLLIGRAERMNKLIDGLLEYANAGQVSNKQKVDLNTVLSKVISEIPSTKNTEIIVENKLPTIYCDKNFITRVFWHIINNAVRYSDKSQRQIKIGCAPEDGFWKFSISDNGPGIDHKYFEKIFKIGQKLSPHDIVGGTGIGLSIAKKIIEDEGGKIWLESVINKGSTFYFTLPHTSSKVNC